MKKHCFVRIITVLLLFAVLCTSVFCIPVIAEEADSAAEEEMMAVTDPADEVTGAVDSAEEAETEEAAEEETEEEVEEAEETASEEVEEDVIDVIEEDVEETEADEESEDAEAEPEEEVLDEAEESEEVELFEEPVETASINSVTEDTTGIVLAWDEFTDAKGYIVSKRMSEEEEWAEIADTEDLTYTDTEVENSKGYYYALQTYTLDGENKVLSEYSESVFCIFISAPAMTAAGAGEKGMNVLWDAVEGAAYYLVYRKADGAEEYEYIGKADGTSFVDEECESGTKYFYSARAVVEEKAEDEEDGRTFKSGMEEPGVSYTYLATPVLNSASNIATGITVKWTKVTGATGYYVYRRTTSTGYSRIAEVGDVATYTDKKAKDGALYIYTIRPKTSDGCFGFYDKAGVRCCWVGVPQITSLPNQQTGITIVWTKVSKADGYYVYRKLKGETTWKRIRNVYSGSTTYCVDRTAEDGKAYDYIVRAFRTAGKVNYSGAVSDMKTRYRLARPSSIVVKKASKGFTVTWKAVNRATKYRVYRKIVGKNTWQICGDTTGTTFNDTAADQSVQYYYTVVAFNSTGRSNYLSPGTISPNTAQGAMVSKAQNYSSATNYLILVNCTTNRFGVFYGYNGNWQLKYYWQCTTGRGGAETCKGVYSIKYKGPSFDGEHLNYTCYYFASFNGAYMIHSTLFKYHTYEDYDSRLGQDLSQGCIRLYINNAKWIYENVPVGTTVVTYAS